MSFADLLPVVAWTAAIVIGVAKAITILTPTPDPSTTWGKVYRGIEVAALLVGKAKDSGIVPTNATADAAVNRIVGAVEAAERPAPPAQPQS